VAIAGFWYRTFGEEEEDRTPAACTLEDILGECILRPSALFRREVWLRCGGFDERFRKGYEDWDFWIGVMERGGRAHIVQEFLFRQRVRERSRNTESDRPEIRARFMEEMIRKHEAVYRKHAIPALIARESRIGELRHWTKQQHEAKRWFLARNAGHERRIARLDAEVGLRAGELQALREEAAGLDRQHAANEASLAAVRRAVETREEELSTLRSSGEWRLGRAFQEAAHSPRAALLLPMRVLRYCLGRRSNERAESR
jgi:Skp family chaperone for outer membrane proteins